jgi:hypothetical protein
MPALKVFLVLVVPIALLLILAGGHTPVEPVPVRAKRRRRPER